MNNALPPQKRPPQPIPEPLRAAEIGTFTHHSVVVRLPNIGREILADNAFSPSTAAALENLRNEIPYGAIRPLTDTDAPAPLLALRTIKSEVAAGITAEKIKQAQQEDPNWLTNGRWGLIQLANDH